MLRLLALALTGATLAGCASGSGDAAAAMAAAAVPPTEALRALVATEGRGLLLYPDAVQDAEISFVGTTSTGSRWVCVRALTGSAAAGFTTRQAIAVLSSEATLMGTQTDCPTCAEPGLRWLPFPELGADPWRERAPAPPAQDRVPRPRAP